VSLKFKIAGALGSALPDPVKDNAALAPLPAPAIENKPAPGQTGPRGMAPRTTYSRVNTGSPPVMDAGASPQKGGPNRGMESLPAKVAAQRGFMTMKERPLLHDMVKAAMAGTTQRLSVNIEAEKQASARTGVKTASAPESVKGHVPTELAIKLADALGYIQSQIIKEADLMPGQGPGALQVMQATSSETNIDAGDRGQATSKNQPPRSPALQAEQVQEGNAGTGLETNDDMQHPEQPVEPIKNEKTSSAKLASRNLERLMKVGAKKTAAPVKLLRKLAEDAINPAQISSPANVDPSQPPPGAAPSGEEVPSEPSDVTSQKSMISSNESAINYTKGQAKANPKSDVAQVLTEPPLSSSTDKVLNEAFDNTGRAGVKISSAKQPMQKTAMKVYAQRAYLGKLLEKAANADCAKEPVGKDKKSTGMAPSTPQAATGANAATMGM